MKLKEILRLTEAEHYESTGENAQPEIQEAVERWKNLPEEERLEKPLLYWLLGSGTPDYKMDRGEANYTDKSKVKNQTCANCEYIYLKIANKKFICSQVTGHIDPKGWCRLWKPGNETD